jgi:hypothetical protein
MLDEVMKYGKLLNSEEILESGWLKRNAIYYKLITYINHTIALFIGENYNCIPVFIQRASKELDCLIHEQGFHEKYFDIAEEYLYMLTKCLIINSLIDEYLVEEIPGKYRDGLS